MTTLRLAQRARKASTICMMVSNTARRKALLAIAKSLLRSIKDIVAANQKDIRAARRAGLSDSLINRLELTPQAIKNMATAVRAIADQPDVVGEIIEQRKRPNGLRICRERVPIGVVAMIFESRPNVVVDCSALAIKSGNAIILKGGKEATQSNAILGKTIRSAIAPFLPEDAVIVLDSRSRKPIAELLHLPQYIDLVIPRGGEGLVRYVVDNAKMPVIAHYKGLCHVYVHSDATIKQAIAICMNAKVQRPGVCNAMETLLVHKSAAPKLLSKLVPLFLQSGVDVRGCDRTRRIMKAHVKKASAQDWDTEYLDKIISVRVVSDIDEAIAHIQRHGTHHTEAILARDRKAIQKFRSRIDASCIVINASTRFNDGGELGLGAEMGISTSKIHAYGPMGARELTTTRFVVQGKGQVRS